jgi:hypothetical protein
MERERRTPEEVFPGMRTSEWAMYLCRLLIMYEKQIKHDLRSRNYEYEFSNKIANWWKRWETLQPDSCEEAARELFEICDQCGVIEFMMSNRYLEPATIRLYGVGVRGRGMHMHPFIEMKKEMKRVAELFS